MAQSPVGAWLKAESAPTNLIDHRHELVRLGELIDWQAFSEEWSPQFTSSTGRPALPTRLMAALLNVPRAENRVRRQTPPKPAQALTINLFDAAHLNFGT